MDGNSFSPQRLFDLDQLSGLHEGLGALYFDKFAIEIASSTVLWGVATRVDVAVETKVIIRFVCEEVSWFILLRLG